MRTSWRQVHRVFTGCSSQPDGSIENRKTLEKGTGFDQPLPSHEHWHIDVAHINIGGTFYFLCSVPDGFKSLPCAQGVERNDESMGGGNDRAARAGEDSWRDTSDHQRQFLPIHRDGLPIFRADSRADSRPQQSLLSAKQWEAGTMARQLEAGVHSA